MNIKETEFTILNIQKKKYPSPKGFTGEFYQKRMNTETYKRLYKRQKKHIKDYKNFQFILQN